MSRNHCLYLVERVMSNYDMCFRVLGAEYCLLAGAMTTSTSVPWTPIA